MDDRDLLAMIAMLGLISNTGYSRGVAPMAYDIAEAMLREREERDGDTE